jgi:cytochrome b561
MKIMLKKLRIVQAFLLISGGVFIFLPQWAQTHPSKQPLPIVLYTIAGNACVIVGIALFVRWVMILRAETVLAANPEDRAALARWATGHIVVFALCESIVLFGIILRYMGFTLAQVTAFYILGAGMMLYASPRLPLNQS